MPAERFAAEERSVVGWATRTAAVGTETMPGAVGGCEDGLVIGGDMNKRDRG
jgi:hypothetical protein